MSKKHIDHEMPASHDAHMRLLKAGLNVLSTGFGIFDRELRLAECNKAFGRLRGYPSALCETGVHIAELYRYNAERGDYGPGDTKRLVESRVAKAQKFRHRQLEYELPTGRILNIRYDPIPRVGLLLSYRDVTDRRRAEDALKESEARHKLVERAATEGIYDWDVVKGELHTSPNMRKMFGFRASEIDARSWNWESRVYPDDLEDYKHALEEHFAGRSKVYKCEYRIRGKRDSMRWILDRGVCVRDSAGRPVRLVGAITDISEWKKLEQTLRESEARYSIALQAINEGVYDWNVESGDVYYSPRVYASLGLSRKDLKTASDWLERLHPEDREVLHRATAAHFKGETERLECDLRYRSSNGEWRWARQHGFALRNDAGQVYRMVGSAGDITALKDSEAELTQKTQILERTLENMDQGISMVDGNLRVIAFNQKFLDLLEFPPEQFKLGYHMEEAFRYNAERGEYGPGDIEEQVQERLELARRFEPHHFERKRPDGTVIEIHGRPLPHKSGFVTTYTDITERKNAELELQAAREEAERARRHLSDAIEAISEGIVLFDKDDRVVVCNSTYKRYFAATAGEDVAKMITPGAEFWAFLREAHARGMLPRIDSDGGIDAYIEMRKAMRKSPNEPIEQLLSDGRWLQISECRTADGGIASVYTDITALKVRESDLAAKTSELEALSAKLSKYLSPQIYSSIFSGAQNVEIASKRKKLTIFFSDIEGFTETTDRLESEELTALLNQYLTEMSRIALHHGATIDKFVGDAVMLFFGDPESKGAKGDAVACVRMAIEMQRRMRELQVQWWDKGLESPFQLRIGINTGYCTVGNFGSENRMDYTIIGNEVNLAARLQSHAEPGGILLANETYSLVKDDIMAEEGDMVPMKGFARPVRTFKVKGVQDARDEQKELLCRKGNGYSLTVDRAKLNPRRKRELIKALGDLASQLEDI